MKGRALSILVILTVGLLSAFLAYQFFNQPQAPEEWLQTEFALSDAQSLRIREIKLEYEPVCAHTCARIRESDTRLARLLEPGQKVTPALWDAIAETENVREECRMNMRAHFQKISEVLPPEQRIRYLRMVIPLIAHPEEMAAFRNPAREP